MSHSSSGHLGGAEHSLLTTLERWGESQPLEVIVVGPTPSGAMTAALQSEGVEVHDRPMPAWVEGDGRGGAAHRSVIRRQGLVVVDGLRSLLRDRHIELVVSNTIVQPWGALAAATESIPHVWMVREFGDAEQGFEYPFGRQATRRAIASLSTLVVANSRAVAADYAPDLGVDPVVSYPPVDLERVRAAGASTSSLRVGTILSVVVPGRLTHAKGQWRVIEALGRLAVDGRASEVIVQFVGGASSARELQALREQATRAGVLDRVAFVGEQSVPFSTMAAADVIVVPSGREAFGRTTLEALALGVPVITTRSGAGSELVDGQCGILVDPESTDELADAILFYIDHPDERQAHGERARKRADALMAGPFALDALLPVLSAAASKPPGRLPDEWRLAIERGARAPVPRGLAALARFEKGIHRAARGVRHPVRTLSRLTGRRASLPRYDVVVTDEASE